MNNSRDDELMEALLKKVSSDYIKKESAAIDAEKAEEHDFGKAFDKDMDKLVKKMRAKKRFSNAGRYAAGAVAAVLVFAVVNPNIATAYKQKFLNIFRHEEGGFIQTDYFSANVEYPIEKFPEEFGNIYAPSALPSGYSVKDIKSGVGFYSVIYERNGTELEFRCINSDRRTSIVDNENHENKKVRLKAGEGLYTYGENDAMLQWETDEYGFSLYGHDLSESDYIKTADSVALVTEEKQ